MESIDKGSVDKEFARTFGNYNLHGIEEVHLPEAISWMPQTIGWKVLAGLLLLAFVYFLYCIAKNGWRNRYRREALKQLAQLESEEDRYRVVCRLPFLLKATALQCFSRGDIASLSGEPWLTFLSDHYSGPSFNDALGRQLIMITYQNRQQWTLSDDDVSALVERTRDWIKRHQVPTTTHSLGEGVAND